MRMTMEEAVRRYLEQRAADSDSTTNTNRFFEQLVMKDLHLHHVERGRVLCFFTVPFRLSDGGNLLHSGAIATLVDLVGSAVVFTHGSPITGVSVEINISYVDAAYVDEEIEIEAKSLRVGKAVAVVSVELRKKGTGKIIAQGRHTKYLPVSSKM